MIRALFFAIFIFTAAFGFAQKSKKLSDDNSEDSKKLKRFQVGIFAGSHFPNKYSAQVYDGYGFDQYGQKNTFLNSALYRKIVLENTSVYSQSDEIALALNVNPGEWTLDESDMPVNMKYSTSFLMGFLTQFRINKKESIVANIYSSKLNTGGNFTITTLNSSVNSPTPGTNNVHTFSITGVEKRLLFQLGYQSMMGEPESVNLFTEIGANVSVTKFSAVQAHLNSLNLDLTYYYTQTPYGVSLPENLSGTGIGGYAGIGLNISVNTNLTVQLLYNPSYDKINIGELPKYKLQHTAGFRAYGTF